jgi:hypothetical protein
MSSRFSRLAGVAVLALAARSLQAQQPAGTTNPPPAAQASLATKPFSFGIALTSMAIVPAAANGASVHNQTVGLQLDAGYLFKHLFYVGADIGPQMLSDHASFTQTTTGGDKSSTASVMYFSAMAGPRTPEFGLGRWQGSFTLLGGVSATSGKRSIDNCVDCSSSTIKIPGGAFVQPTLLIGGDGARLRLAQRQYLTGDGIRYVSSLGVELGGR